MVNHNDIFCTYNRKKGSNLKSKCNMSLNNNKVAFPNTEYISIRMNIFCGRKETDNCMIFIPFCSTTIRGFTIALIPNIIIFQGR